MANIDKDLISNKASCYIFDIDGCIADVDHLLLTYEQAYEKNMEAFNLAEEKYKSDYNAYQYLAAYTGRFLQCPRICLPFG